MIPVDGATVTEVAHAALTDQEATVVSWTCEPIHWQAIAPTTGALDRYRGIADDGRPWSAVRKVLTRPPGAAGSNWERESAIYASGMLGDLPGIRAPRCYRIDHGDGEVALWLEEVTDTVGRWPVSRYAIAARHLGRFNGNYLAGRPLPDRALLRTDWLRSWVGAIESRVGTLDDPAVTDVPRVRRLLPPALHGRVRRLHQHRETLLAALDAQPQTFSHLDAWRTNLIANDRGPDPETVVIDWSVAGLAPAGQELAVLVTGSRTWLDVAAEDGPALEHETFAAYIEGLREGGWQGSEAAVRFAYCASAGLWAGIAMPVWLRWFADPARQEWVERKYGRPLDDAVGPLGQFLEYALDLSDEALDTVGSVT